MENSGAGNIKKLKDLLKGFENVVSVIQTLRDKYSKPVDVVTNSIGNCIITTDESPFPITTFDATTVRLGCAAENTPDATKINSDCSTDLAANIIGGSRGHYLTGVANSIGNCIITTDESPFPITTFDATTVRLGCAAENVPDATKINSDCSTDSAANIIGGSRGHYLTGVTDPIGNCTITTDESPFPITTFDATTVRLGCAAENTPDATKINSDCSTDLAANIIGGSRGHYLTGVANSIGNCIITTDESPFPITTFDATTVRLGCAAENVPDATKINSDCSTDSAANIIGGSRGHYLTGVTDPIGNCTITTDESPFPITTFDATTVRLGCAAENTPDATKINSDCSTDLAANIIGGSRGHYLTGVANSIGNCIITTDESPFPTTTFDATTVRLGCAAKNVPDATKINSNCSTDSAANIIGGSRGHYLTGVTDPIGNCTITTNESSTFDDTTIRLINTVTCLDSTTNDVGDLVSDFVCFDEENVVFDNQLIDAILNFNTIGNLPISTFNATTAESCNSIHTAEVGKTIHTVHDETLKESLMLLHEGHPDSQTVRHSSKSNDRQDRKKSTNTEVEDTVDLMNNIDPTLRSCDNSKMVTQKFDGQAKKLFCIFCKKMYPALARHLEHVHKNEPEIQELAGLAKGSRERKSIFANLRNRGYFEFDTNATLNNRKFLTSRLPNKRAVKNPGLYTFCVKCCAPLTKTSINQHFRRCTNKKMIGQRSVLLLGRLLEGRIHEMANHQMRMTILPVLREDEVVQAIRFDWLIIVFGNKLCTKYTAHYQQAMIRSLLRLSGRVLLATKSIRQDVIDLASIFQPKMYDSVIEAIRIVGKFDIVSNEFKSTSTALACVTQLRQIGSLLVAEYIKKEDSELQLKTENFIKLLNIDAGITINRPVNDSRAKAKRLKVERIPTTEDIKMLAEYLDRELSICFSRLTEGYSYVSFVRLCEITMASIIVYNRRRVGDTQNIILSEFHVRESLDDEVLSKLQAADKKAATKYKRMQVRGKLGRKVPVLLKPAIEKCIQLIIDLRKHAGVADENEFLFALPAFVKNRIRVVNGCRALSKFANACGAKDPQSLRGTTLRKQLASFCIPMGLDDNSVSEVAAFMGHRDQVHRDHYRKSTTFREIVYMSKLLEAAQGDDKIDEEDGGDDDDEDYEDDGADEADDEYDLDMTVDNHVNEEDINATAENNVPVHKKRNLKRKLESSNSIGNGTTNNEALKKQKRWNEEEKAGALEAFASYFKTKTKPSLKVVTQQRNDKKYFSILKNRTPAQIRAWIVNNLKDK